jgi:hypothetical protein
MTLNSLYAATELILQINFLEAVGRLHRYKSDFDDGLPLQLFIFYVKGKVTIQRASVSE